MVITMQKRDFQSSEEKILLEIGARIKKCRLEKSFTREQLSEKSGLSVQAICKIEDGERNFKVLSLLSLSRALGVSSSFLLGISPYSENDNITELLSHLEDDDKAFVKSVLEAYLYLINNKNLNNGGTK